MHVQHSPTGRVAVLAVDGELDVVGAQPLRRALLALMGTPLIVVDLSEVTFLDSTCIGVLVGAASRAESAGGRLIALNATGLPARALRITGLGRVLSPVR